MHLENIQSKIETNLGILIYLKSLSKCLSSWTVQDVFSRKFSISYLNPGGL